MQLSHTVQIQDAHAVYIIIQTDHISNLHNKNYMYADATIVTVKKPGSIYMDLEASRVSPHIHVCTQVP